MDSTEGDLPQEEQLDEAGRDTDRVELLQLHTNENEDDLFDGDGPISPVSRCAPAWTPKVSFSSDVNQQAEREKSLKALYFCAVITSLGLAITISSLWPYAYQLNMSETPRILGWIYFAMAGSSICGIATFATWARFTSPKFPMISSMFFLFGGGALHFIAQSVVNLNTKILLMSRCLCAIAAAVSIIYFISLNQMAMIHERTTTLLKLMTAQGMGYMLGAALQALMTLAGERGLMWHKNSLHFNAFTSVGLIIMVLAAINLVVVVFYLKLPSLAGDSNRIQGEPYSSRERRRKRRKHFQKKEIAPDYKAVLVCLIALFILDVVRTYLETMATLLGIDQLQWTRIKAIQVTAGIQIIWACVAILALWTTKTIAGRVGERFIITVGVLLIFILTLILIPYRDSDTHPRVSQNATCEYAHCGSQTKITNVQFLLVLLLFPFGYFPALMVLFSRYEKIARPLQKVSSMSFWLITQACAQLVGPISFTSLYVDTDLRWSVLSLAIFPGLCLVLLLITYKRLVSYHVYLIAKQTSGSKERLDVG